uniref:Cell division cycle protein 27 homolog n=1 Tax=Plectus sambesii TaxID=2011161 RepID=A0A914XQK5_9BILA
MHATVVPTSVENVIRQCLEHYALDDAAFLAELYYDQAKTDTALWLLATCHYRAGRTTAAYTLLKLHGAQSVQTRFLFAKCCLDLDKLQEAEELLTACDSDSTDGTAKYFGDSAPFARSLLAQLYCKTARVKAAVAESKLGLRQNPFLWSTLQRLCQTGTDADMEAVAGMYARFLKSGHEEKSTPYKEPSSVERTPVSDISLERMPEDTPVSAPSKIGYSSTSSPFGITPEVPSLAPGKHVPCAPRKSKVAVPSKRAESKRQEPNSTKPTPPSSQIQTRSAARIAQRFGCTTQDQNSENDSAPSHRLPPRSRNSSKQLQSTNRLNQLNVEDNRSTPGVIESTNKRSLTQTPVKDGDQSLKPESKTHSPAYDKMLDTLARLSPVTMALSRFDSRRALELINALPDGICGAPMVLMMRARAHFEATEYNEAVKVFKECRRRYEHYLDGVEMFSTALWHLQCETDLSSLSQELTLHYRLAPQTWCVAGNCFSLQKEHDTAIKLFERAIQLDPEFAYAYSLLGHELISIENYTRAAQAFRSALRLQPNNYYAWYGLGTIFYKQEQLALARVHFLRALDANPRNSVLICQLSVVEQALKNPDEAMRLLDRALKESPNNAACRYHRAYLLFAKERHEEALAELSKLKLIAPKEAQAFSLTGKVHKKLQQTHLALMNFSWASEMDPRGEQNHPTIGDRCYDEEPVTALAAIDPEQVGDMQAMDSDASV